MKKETPSDIRRRERRKAEREAWVTFTTSRHCPHPGMGLKDFLNQYKDWAPIG